MPKLLPPKLTVLASHPIQYQVPIWRAIAESGIDLEVLYLDDQGVSKRVDAGFGESFAWDIDLLGGYRSQYVKVREPRDRERFFGIRLQETLRDRFPAGRDHFFWTEGWRFWANWQAVARARRIGAKILMRGDSHGLLERPWHKRLARFLVLRRLLARIDYFLCVGSANRRYYRQLGVPETKCVWAPHCVDNERFRFQSNQLRASRQELRNQWRIASDAKVVLFCGKLQSIKNPEDIAAACEVVRTRNAQVHVLYVGTGSLEPSLRTKHDVRFSWDEPGGACDTPAERNSTLVPASFAGFVNQSEIAKAYAVADVLVLPSRSETWGLVVNEAMASGLPVVVSDQVGCAEDLPARLDRRLVYRVNDIGGFADAIHFALESTWDAPRIAQVIDEFHIRHVVAAITRIMAGPTRSASQAWARA